MLQIKNIKKEYRTGDLVQKALNDVSLSFRDSEFVSILGPSGSGKTTLLNIIGGLDSYDSGDLIINGTSTKNYKDRDWDTYRNYTIGFVFQSYNLIPHQSVLGNVELALTIGGISKRERTKKAKEALERVGLKDHIHKRPNQLSGGQMQRVAIARALVNDPDILLADEPTGALDTETSVQIMELLKEVAKDRLVVMVTHNPELADEYSSRIVKLRDGKIVDDSNEFVPEKNAKSVSKLDAAKKVKMNMATSLSLSFKNLLTKKRRTLLTAFAGSIGIIGIALIISFSTGVNLYIENLQRDTMSSYPITITAETLNMSGMMSVGMEQSKVVHDEDKVYSNHAMMQATASMTITNNLTEFKNYLDDPSNELNQFLGESGILYSYDANFDVLSYDKNGDLVNTEADPTLLLEQTSSIGMAQNGMAQMSAMTALMMGSSSAANNFGELTSGGVSGLVNEGITESYNLLYGKWPEAYDEVVLFLSNNNSVMVEQLYQLGLLTADEYIAIDEAIGNDEVVEETVWDYQAVLDHKFYMTTASDRFLENEDGTFSFLSDEFYAENSDALAENTELKIVGIVKPKDGAQSLFNETIGYTTALTDYVIERTNESAVVLAQENDPEVNVLTGSKFEASSDEEKAQYAIEVMSALGVTEKAQIYMSIMSAMPHDSATQQAPTATEGEEMPTDMSAMAGMSGMQSGQMDEVTLAGMLDAYLAGEPDQGFLLAFYDNYLGDASYNDNMKTFGKVSYDAPTAINIYTDTFEDKDAVALAIENYNETADENNQIVYTDMVEALTSSITTMIDVVSYVLIAFVAVSLIVSCIMIGIITHISVMERTKEIGVLRALGASKKNISQVFNAETIIIGLCSGLIGVGLTALMNLPITAIVQNLIDSDDLIVSLPIVTAFVLVAISVIITVFGGLIPARSAAKKDPVIALRTE